jgi:hypothetical protein
MLAILHLLGTFVTNLFKSRRRLEVENLLLRHQLNIALRRTPSPPFLGRPSQHPASAGNPVPARRSELPGNGVK